MTDFATWLRERREEVGISQIELAAKLGISNQLISNVERGISLLAPKHFRKLANALDCELAEPIDIYLDFHRERQRAHLLRETGQGKKHGRTKRTGKAA